MTPIADFVQLSKGVLAFPAEINGLNRRPHPLDTVIRWASTETWRAWAEIDSAELWQIIALHLYLEPNGLNWERLLHIADREHTDKSVATLFERRYRRACEHLPSGNLPSVAARQPGRSVVRLADFVEWALVNSVPLPAEFPRAASVGHAEVRPAAPAVLTRVPQPDATPIGAPAAVAVLAAPVPVVSKTRKPRTATTALDGYIRQAELLSLVSFSAATLWRNVKAGKFPAPVKLSSSITAWRRADYDAWAASHHITPKASRKRKPG